jgi:hypothetical protein
MYRTLRPVLLVLGTVVAGCSDQNEPTAPSSDKPPIAFATSKPRGGGFDNANNVGSIPGTQWEPSPWTNTSDVSAIGSPCWDQGFCAAGTIVNPDFLAPGVLTFGAAPNSDPNPAEGCVDLGGNPSVKCYALLSTTSFFRDTTENGIDDPVEFKTLRSGIQTQPSSPAQFPPVLDANTGWQLNFDYAVLTDTPPAGSTDAFAAVYLDYDSDGNTTLDQTAVVLQIFRSDLEQGKVPLKAGGCGTSTLGGVTSTYPLCTGWQFRTFDASFLGGKLFRIRIIVDEGGIDSDVATSFAIDNVKFEETVLVSSASAQPNPAQVNTPVSVNGSFTDTEIISHTATIDWGDGNITAGVVVEPGSGTPGAVSGTHNYVNPGTYSGSVTVSDGSGAPGQAKFTVTVTATTAAVIDVRPGVKTNEIFLRFNLPIPVLLLGGPGFNVRSVAVSSLRFGPAGARPLFGAGLVFDANRDGFPDLLTSYLTRQTGIQPGATQACLSGTKAGAAFQGCDAIKTVGAP